MRGGEGGEGEYPPHLEVSCFGEGGWYGPRYLVSRRVWISTLLEVPYLDGWVPTPWTYPPADILTPPQGPNIRDAHPYGHTYTCESITLSQLRRRAVTKLCKHIYERCCARQAAWKNYNFKIETVVKVVSEQLLHNLPQAGLSLHSSSDFASKPRHYFEILREVRYIWFLQSGFHNIASLTAVFSITQ